MLRSYIWRITGEIYCSTHVYHWRRALHDCLESGGVPVGSDVPLVKIDMVVKNETFWIADYLEYKFYTKGGE